jgi:hypothetical protein
MELAEFENIERMLKMIDSHTEMIGKHTTMIGQLSNLCKDLSERLSMIERNNTART